MFFMAFPLSILNRPTKPSGPDLVPPAVAGTMGRKAGRRPGFEGPEGTLSPFPGCIRSAAGFGTALEDVKWLRT
jgi:hypothetical protein